MKIKSIALSVVALLLGSPLVWANTANFNITASVPQAVDVGFFTSRVDSTSGNFTNLTGTGGQNLDFGTLGFSSAAGVFLPNHFYAIDVGAIDAAGNSAALGARQFSNITLAYSGDTTPAGATHGLSTKATVTYVKVTGPNGNQEETIFNRKLFRDVSPITPAQFSGGFLRLYVGIHSGEIFTDFPLPTDAAPFTPSDMAGSYSGTLTITASVQ